MEEIIKQQLGHESKIVSQHIHSLIIENIRNTDPFLAPMCTVIVLAWFSMGSIGFYVQKLVV